MKYSYIIKGKNTHENLANHLCSKSKVFQNISLTKNEHQYRGLQTYWTKVLEVTLYVNSRFNENVMLK